MKKYDVIIIGTGSGASLVENALAHNMTVALVDKGPVGGTCLNLGCIPSKLMIFPADRVMEIREAAKFGIKAEIAGIDFARIMNHMQSSVTGSRDRMRRELERAEEFDFYSGTARFIADYTIEVNRQTIQGDMIFLASGARPDIPQIRGIDTIPYLTNESVLQLKKRPESLAIIGGGYIAAEFAHFFEAMGTRVTIIQRNVRLVPQEEPEVSERLRKSLSRRMEVLTGTEVVEVGAGNREVTVTAEARMSGEHRKITAQHVLLAAGRTSNADLLQVAKTGVDTDARGYIAVTDFLETSKKNIWAFGDAIGRQMFRHAANHEAHLVWDNAVHGKKERMDFRRVPHAVFSWPEIASIGLTEEQAVEEIGRKDVLVGHASYADVARGQAMMEKEGFIKTLVHRENGVILGCHIIGPQASILIQEVVNAMSMDADLWSMAKGMRIHPALPEVVLQAFSNLVHAA
jgi:mycothione reductase